MTAQHNNRYGAILVRPKANPCDASLGPKATCLEYFEAGYESGSYYISPDGYRKKPMCVYCNMTLEGGGWTLVYRYTFNNYASFTAGSNYVSHIPTWEDHDNWDSSYDLEALESKVAPRDTDEFGVRQSLRCVSVCLCGGWWEVEGVGAHPSCSSGRVLTVVRAYVCTYVRMRAGW